LPPPEPFDPRQAKRIARGRRDIDARLDLHGLRQQDAYTELRRFLAHAQAQGHRHVLIITGKGGGAASEDARDFWTSEQRGVLRRLVPHWLCEPAMRLHVVSFTESALKHGGSGALYVTLRKGPRSRG
jgi:DNA-nicking Smr family endonuclease